jgi:hypothetical protein
MKRFAGRIRIWLLLLRRRNNSEERRCREIVGTPRHSPQGLVEIILLPPGREKLK